MWKPLQLPRYLEAGGTIILVDGFMQGRETAFARLLDALTGGDGEARCQGAWRPAITPLGAPL
jgi:hypothetical protein